MRPLPTAAFARKRPGGQRTQPRGSAVDDKTLFRNKRAQAVPEKRAINKNYTVEVFVPKPASAAFMPGPGSLAPGGSFSSFTCLASDVPQ